MALTCFSNLDALQGRLVFEVQSASEAPQGPNSFFAADAAAAHALGPLLRLRRCRRAPLGPEAMGPSAYPAPTGVSSLAVDCWPRLASLWPACPCTPQTPRLVAPRLSPLLSHLPPRCVTAKMSLLIRRELAQKSLLISAGGLTGLFPCLLHLIDCIPRCSNKSCAAEWPTYRIDV